MTQENLLTGFQNFLAIFPCTLAEIAKMGDEGFFQAIRQEKIVLDERGRT
jgi:hypothetical protein